MRSCFWLVLLLLCCLMACKENPASETLFALQPPAETGLDFSNTIQEDTAAFNLVDYYYIYNGAGVAVGDVNNDSLPDLYFTGNRVPGRLYLNRGNLRFDDITEAAGIVADGWATGATFADVNADGYLDLYISRAGPHPPAQRANLFYLNNGDATFTEQAAALGVADTSYSTQAAFFDYDKDGDLDLYLLNHSTEFGPNQIRPIITDGSALSADHLYRQEADGTFTDVSIEAGIVYPGQSLGVSIGDVNGDGWEDVYVANDFMAHDLLYLNNGDGTFNERGSEVLKHHSFAAMGSDLADINNDGRVDIMVVDMRPPDNEQQKRMAFPFNFESFHWSLEAGYHPQYWRNTLHLNNGLNAAGELTFSDIGQYAGVEATDWSWAPLFADFDNDGLQDLFITNGYRRAVIDLDFIKTYGELQRRQGVEASSGQVKEMAKQMYDMARIDYVYRNRGDLTFEDVSSAWGLTEPSFSNGAAYADFDLDGDLDVVLNRIDAPAALYENRLRDSHFLKVYLEGTGRNTHGLGADLRLYCDGQMQHRHHAVTRGYQSSVDYALHFGLGTCEIVDSLHVVWPDGATQHLTEISTNQMLRLHQREAQPGTWTAPPLPAGLLTDATAALGLSYKHQEEPYNDFRLQRLLPHQHSQMGPALAVGDVNEDEREDIFVGGSFRHSGQVFVQQPDGTFRGSPLTTQDPKYEEDMGALFFDADNDGDLDLYVASGSNEFPEGSPYFQDRLYLGDGRGGFALAPEALPDLRTSTATVLAADYDQDGDLDLFVGGRLKSSAYPMPGRSYLLRNEGGTFSDVTRALAPGLQQIGMVTSGLWTDFNTDGRVDLIVAGEFMPFRFFENAGNRFNDVTGQTGLEHTEGWWNSIVGGDFDRDGDTDYVAGNLGLNTRFQASPTEPVTVYAKSFDFDGIIDPVLTHYVQGKEYPVASWDNFIRQLPRKSLQFATYESYGKATFTDLFTPKERENAPAMHATRFESSYIENLGGGRFALRPLPGPAQLAPLFGLVIDDVDRDGNLDILAVGNSYAPDVITGRHDALIGLYLRGDGQEYFEAVPHQESGFFVDGDAKALVRLYREDGTPLYVASQNNDLLRAFAHRNAVPAKTVTPASLDAYALVMFADGTTQRQELYYGTGYLSQSSRRFWVPAEAVEITFYTSDGTARGYEVK